MSESRKTRRKLLAGAAAAAAASRLGLAALGRPPGSVKISVAGWSFHREVFEEYPPVTSYSLQRRARPLYRALVPLAQAV